MFIVAILVAILVGAVLMKLALLAVSPVGAAFVLGAACWAHFGFWPALVITIIASGLAVSSRIASAVLIGTWALIIALFVFVLSSIFGAPEPVAVLVALAMGGCTFGLRPELT